MGLAVTQAGLGVWREDEDEGREWHRSIEWTWESLNRKSGGL